MEGKTYDADRLLYLDVTCNMGSNFFIWMLRATWVPPDAIKMVTRPSVWWMEISH
jgi:hypothetical protein